MELKINEIAERIRSLRDIMEFSVEEMATAVECSPEEYIAAEAGQTDFSFTFIYKCAEKLGVDMIELLTGENPRLSFYSIVRKGEGLPMKRRSGFNYYHLAARFKGKKCEPFLVTAPYKPEEHTKPIALSRHEGQELDFIVKGSLKVALEDHIEVLSEGDCVLYDSSHGHGMIATGGSDCEFLAIILKK
ncbi:MAG: helix-turn-helix transcriptional regulator [Clostridiales bacterium]|nr:helix-turn-helix transcriptional regulator [Clostridiales bacterium]